MVVVGAGPAGCTAAFHLCQQGQWVLLIDQNPPGRSKPCGGGMAASVQRLFPFELSPAVDRVIRQVRFSWCLDDPVSAQLPGNAPFWICRRSRLDAFLAEQAQAAGTQLCFNWQVKGIIRQQGLWRIYSSGDDSVTARGLVLADGSGSRFATELGLGPPQPRFASAISVEVDAPTPEPDTARFEFGMVRHGFCWAFPREGGYSIGVGTFIGRQEVDADAVLAALLPSLGLPVDAGVRRREWLRIWNGHHPLHNEAAVVVGDAASLSDPFLAEGLRPSLISGFHAAESMAQWLTGDQAALGGYSRRMRQDWGESMAWGKRIAQVFYRFPKVGYQLGVKRPTAPQRIAQILSGEMDYGDIAQRVIKRLLLRRS